MAKTGNADRLLGNDIVLATVKGIFRGMREANYEEGEGGADRPVALPDLVDALSLTIAALLEFDPSYQTPRDMRKAGELVGSNVATLMRGLRDHYEETGKHMADTFIVPHKAH